MDGMLTSRNLLRILLLAIALHSVAVGVGLMLHPAGLLATMGYQPIGEPFFPSQGGIFHFVMAVCYLMGARDPERNEPLIRFAIIVKFVALIFLVGYWLMNRQLVVVLASGLVDGAMGVVLLLAYRRWQRG